MCPVKVLFSIYAKPPFLITALEDIPLPINSITNIPLSIYDNSSNANSYLFLIIGMIFYWIFTFYPSGFIPSKLIWLSNLDKFFR